MNRKSILLGVMCILNLFVIAQTTVNHSPADTLGQLQLRKEPRFTVNVHAGYAVGLGSTFKFYPDDISSIMVNVVNGNPSSKSTTYKSPSKGLGEGFRIGAGLSYTINDFINVGIDLDYFHSTISKIRDSTYRETMSSNSGDYTYKEEYSISYDANLLTITPNITFKAISRPKWFIYNKVGAVITIRPNSIQREKQNISSSMNWQGFIKDSSSYSEKKYDWGIRNPAFGFMGGLGVQVKLFENVRAFTEIQFSHIVFQVRTRSLTEYVVDGKDMVNTLPVSSREIEFEKTLNASESFNNPNQPTKAIVQRFPVTYVGLQLGVAYRF